MSVRYAIYFAPGVASPWRFFSARWLGRDDITGMPLNHAPGNDFSESEIAALTAAPRHYGFHATLKAPFRLAAGHGEAELLRRCRQLARSLERIELGPLHLAVLGDFVALAPDGRVAELQALAFACVTQLDDLRAPLNEADMARRQLSGLDTRETELLALHGYPYVMERFRFHMTLTGPVDFQVAQLVCQTLEPEVMRLNRQTALSLDRICVFKDPGSGEPFVRIADLELGS